MADYPMTGPSTSTPQNDPFNPLRRPLPDPLAIQHMLATLRAIPRDELPNGDDRDALAWLIERGYVDNLYTPFGCPTHTIAWAHRPAWCDPRETVADWLAARRMWEQRGELDPQRKELADAGR